MNWNRSLRYEFAYLFSVLYTSYVIYNLWVESEALFELSKDC